MSKEEELEEAPKSNKKLFIILGVVFLLVIGAAVGFFVLKGGDVDEGSVEDTEEVEEEEEEDEDKKKEKKKKKKNKKVDAEDEPSVPLYINLEPAFVVNLQGSSRNYLQVKVTLMTRDPEVEKILLDNIPWIKNELVNLFNSKNYAYIKEPDSKNKLQQESLVVLQDLLDNEFDVEGLDQVLFIHFIAE